MSTSLLDQQQTRMDEQEPIKDIYVYIVREQPEEIIVEAEPLPPSSPRQDDRLAWIITIVGWLLILSITAYGLLLALPATATITLISAEQQVTAEGTFTLPAHIFPTISKSESETVPTTGHGHTPARQATGYVTFYNALTSPQTIGAGTSLVGALGIQVITDVTAYVPAGNLSSNGQATVRAHAIAYGPQGNIKAGDIYGPCCKPFIQVVNSAFSGGQNSRDFQAVAKSDIDGITSSLTTQVAHSMQTSLATLAASDETLVMPVPCTTQHVSNHPIGAEANMVTIKVSETCNPLAYKTSEFLAKASNTLTEAVPGRTIRLGEITAHISKAVLQEQVLLLTVNASGDFGYRYDSQALAKVVAGKSQQEASRLLLQLPGIERVQVQGTIPGQADHIHIVVIYQEVTS
jgi:hypothetical protein